VWLLGGRVLHLSGYCGCINFTNQVLVHHCTGSGAMPHIFEIISSILGCKTPISN
jgi:hypothetical protein